MVAREKREFVEFYEAVFSAIKFVIKRYKLNIIAISDKNEAQRLWFDAFMNYSRFELVDRADSTLMDNKSFLSQGSSICEECLRRHLQF